MLQRLDADTYQSTVGDTITIVTQSDDGAPSATFRYLENLRTEQIACRLGGRQLELPGCTFSVEKGRKMFSCGVVFSGGAAPRYDLFEVDESGTAIDLEFPITPDMGPSAQFRINGTTLAALATTPRTRGARARAKAAKEAKGKTASGKKKRARNTANAGNGKRGGRKAASKRVRR